MDDRHGTAGGPAGPDPRRVRDLTDLARELDLLRARAGRSRHRARVSLDELARRVGLPRSTVHAYVSGKHLVPADVLDRIVIALGADPAEQREWADSWFRVAARRPGARRVASATDAASGATDATDASGATAAAAATAATAGDPMRAPWATPRQLPPDVTVFTGREAEFAALDALLGDGGDAGDQAAGPRRAAAGPRIVAITGAGGAGKTALAVRWARRAAGAFPDGQLHVDLRGFDPDRPVPPGDALAGFLRALGVDGSALPPTVDERAALCRSRLDGRRVLVLLDNAADSEHARLLLPGAPSCAVLVTSRDSLAGLVARDGARRVDLDLLPLDDAVALLHALVDHADGSPGSDRVPSPGPDSPPRGLDGDPDGRPDGDPDGRPDGDPDGRPDGRPDGDAGRAHELLRTIAVQCARLPLALRVAAERAAECRAAGVGMVDALAAVAAELADERSRLDALDAGDDPRTAVRAVFSWSYGHLPPDAARLFRLLGLHPGTDVDTCAAAAMAGVEVRVARRLLDALRRAHLVTATAPGRYGMHDLLRAWAAETAHADGDPAGRAAALDRLVDHYVSAARLAADSLVPSTSTTASAARAPDAARAGAWLDAERGTLVAIASWARAVELSTLLWRALDVGGHHEEAARLHELALAAAAHDGDDAGQAAAHGNLGVLRWRTGRFDDALRHLTRALELHRSTGDCHGEARTLSNIGGVHWHRGDTAESFAHTNAALDAATRCGDEALMATAMYNLAPQHFRTGRPGAAADCCRGALQLYVRRGHRLGEASATMGLAIVATRLDRHAEAERLLGHAFDVAAELGDGRALARLTGHRGDLRLRQGRVAEAIACHERALALHRERRERVEEADALAALATALLAAGRLADAAAAAEAARGAAAAIDHERGLAVAANALGEVFAAAGDAAAARSAHREAAEHADRVLDVDERARADAGIASAALALGDAATARAHWLSALATYESMGVREAAAVRARLGALDDRRPPVDGVHGRRAPALDARP